MADDNQKIYRNIDTPYKSEYAYRLIEHMKLGLSFESFGSEIDTSFAIISQWLTKHDDFAFAKSVAESHSRKFWEKLGIAGTVGKIPGFNAACWIFNMKNRFKWTDRVETLSLNQGTKKHFTMAYKLKDLTEDDNNGRLNDKNKKKISNSTNNKT